MSTKAKVSALPRKKSNVLHLDPARIKESDECKWAKTFLEFLDSLSEAEFELT